MVAELWDAAFAHLPDELSDAQWDALFELTELVQDADFGRRIAEQARGFWSRIKKPDVAAWQAATEPLVGPAAAAFDAGEPLDGEVARALVARFVDLSAGALDKKSRRAHERWLLAQAQRADPRAERFWQLVALLRGWSSTPPPRARAFKFLFAALVAQRGQKV